MATFNPLDPIGSIVDFMCESAIEGWKKTASWVLSSGALGDAQWTVANDTLNHVAGVMGFVTVGVGAYSIVKNALRGKPGEVFASLFATMLAWPLTVVCATLLVRGVGVADKLTSRILDWNTPAFDEIELDADVFGDVFGLGFALILAILIVLGGVVMLIMTCVRLFLIILGVGFLPVVTMLIGLDSMRAGIARYANWIIGVILMQPLMAVIMYISGELMDDAGPDAPLTYLVAAAGVILSSLCPWMLVRVVGQFLPFSSGSSSAATAGGDAVGTGVKAVREAADMGVRVATGGLSAAATDLGARTAAADSGGDAEGASRGGLLQAAGRGFGGHAGGLASAAGEYMDARESARDAGVIPDGNDPATADAGSGHDTDGGPAAGADGRTPEPPDGTGTAATGQAWADVSAAPPTDDASDMRGNTQADAHATAGRDGERADSMFAGLAGAADTPPGQSGPQTARSDSTASADVSAPRPGEDRDAATPEPFANGVPPDTRDTPAVQAAPAVQTAPQDAGMPAGDSNGRTPAGDIDVHPQVDVDVTVHPREGTDGR